MSNGRLESFLWSSGRSHTHPESVTLDLLSRYCSTELVSQCGIRSPLPANSAELGSFDDSARAIGPAKWAIKPNWTSFWLNKGLHQTKINTPASRTLRVIGCQDQPEPIT